MRSSGRLLCAAAVALLLVWWEGRPDGGLGGPVSPGLDTATGSARPHNSADAPSTYGRGAPDRRGNALNPDIPATPASVGRRGTRPNTGERRASGLHGVENEGPESNREPGTPPIYLTHSPMTPDSLSARIWGEDSLGPGRAVLWRRTPRGFDRVSEIESDGAGRLDFGTVLVPMRGIELVAVRADEEPEDGRVASSLHLESEILAAPRATASPLEQPGSWRLDLRPTRRDGTVLVSDTQGTVLVSLSLDSVEAGVSAEPFVEVELPASGEATSHLRVAQLLDDGRQSSWRSVPLRRQPEAPLAWDGRLPRD